MSTFRRVAAAGLSIAVLGLGSVAITGGVASAADALSITPDTHLNTGPVTVSVTGGTFVPNVSTISMVRSGDSAHTVTGTVDPTQSTFSKLVATFDLTGALDGAYDVTVGTPLGVSSCSSCFTVTAPPPTVGLEAPTRVIPGAPAAAGNLHLVNPPTGATYTKGRIRLVLSGVPNLKASDVILSIPASSSTWEPIQLTPSNGTLVGYVGAAQGSTVGRSVDQTAPLRFAVASSAPAGSMRIDTVFGTVGVDGTITKQLAKDRDDLVISGVPGVPTAVHAAAGNARAKVTWTAPTRKGTSAITGYRLKTSPACSACTGLSSSDGVTTVKGLKNGVAYRFTVAAKNASGTGLYSTASNRVTPHA